MGRKISNKNKPVHLPELSTLRRKLDFADQRLLRALAERFRTVEHVGKLKKKHKLPIVQKARWNELVENRIAQAKSMNINEKFIRSVLNLIHREAIRIQRGQK